MQVGMCTGEQVFWSHGQNRVFIGFAVKLEVREPENDHLYSVSASKT